MPDIDGTHVCIFENSQLEGSYVGDLLYLTAEKEMKRGDAVHRAGSGGLWEWGSS